MDVEELSELLECSVCLDTLSHDSRVLPCQHTFCQGCLEEITQSKKELRCPECRTLVTMPIRSLPTNILLVRILEGFKNSVSQRGVASKKRSRLAVCRDQVQNSPCARSLFTYETTDSSDLSFRKGDVISLIKQVDENWFVGELKGKRGFVPRSYIEILVPLSSSPKCFALYDFEMEGDTNQDCLSFKKGDVLTITRRVDEHWLEGSIGNIRGIFPINFVEVSENVRQLFLYKDNVRDREMSCCTSTTDSVQGPLQAVKRFANHHDPSLHRTNGCAPASNTAVSRPSSSGGRRAESLLPKTRINPLFSVPRSSPQINPNMIGTHFASVARQSSESTNQFTSCVTHPVSTVSTARLEPRSVPSKMTPLVQFELFASSLGAPTDDGNVLSDLDLSSPNSTLPSLIQSSPDISNMISSITISTEESSRSLTAVTSSHQGSSAQNSVTLPEADTKDKQPRRELRKFVSNAIYVARYSYEPQNSDELRVIKGDYYTITDVYRDGWFCGTSLRTGKRGLLPGNYVHIVESSVPLVPQTCGLSSPSRNDGHPSMQLGYETRAKVERQIPHNRSVNDRNELDLSFSSTNSSDSSTNARHIGACPAVPDKVQVTSSSSSSSNIIPSTADKIDHRGGITRYPKTSYNFTGESVSVSTGNSANRMTNERWPVRNSSNRNSIASIRGLKERAVNMSDWPIPDHYAGSRNSISGVGMSCRQSLVPKMGKSIVMNSHHSKASPPVHKSAFTPVKGHVHDGPLSPVHADTLPDHLCSTPHAEPNLSLCHSMFSPFAGHNSSSSFAKENCPESNTKENSESKVKSKAGGLIRRLSKRGKKSKDKKEPEPKPDVIVYHMRSKSYPTVPAPLHPEEPVEQKSTSCNDSEPLISSNTKPAKLSKDLPAQIMSTKSQKSRHRQFMKEEYRCIVPYPAQSEHEIDLYVGDIVYIQRRREDGWVKGWLPRTNQMGFFPGSFVEKAHS